jgi:Mce-associated membrane protein
MIAMRVSVAEDTSTERETAGEPEPPPPRRWLVAVAALVVLLVGSVVAGGFLLSSVLDQRAVTARRDAILSVAREVAQVSYSLDYERFPEQVSKIAAETTGNYRQGLLDSSKGLQYILTQGKVKSSCDVTAAGVERDDDNTATVLLSITTRVTNTELKVPQTRYYRVAIGLVRQGPQWLVQSNDVIA